MIFTVLLPVDPARSSSPARLLSKHLRRPMDVPDRRSSQPLPKPEHPMRFPRPAAFALALAAAAVPAAAQQATAAGEDDTIVVSGQADMEQQVRSFVGALTQVAPRGGQIARFETTICPLAVGLSDKNRAAVEARIRRVAGAVGLKAAGAKCVPNVLLIVAPDKAELLDALVQKHPHLFGDRSSAEIRRIIREPGPAAAWQVQDLLDGDGVPVQRERGVPTNRTTRPESRITTSGRQYFFAAAVVVESSALEGLSATQLADYAAMRAFARIDPTRLDSTSAPTILRVLGAPRGTALPITLTEWDFGFLKGLYASSANLHGGAQRSEIGHTVEKEVKGGGNGADKPGG